MIKIHSNQEEGVSPVVGVMLMLVITIIIAALVSSFSGSLTHDQKSPPQVTLEITPLINAIRDTDVTNEVPDYPANFKIVNGIKLRHTGGEPFSLKDIDIQLKSRDAAITFDYDTVFDPSQGKYCADASSLLAKDSVYSRYLGLVGGGSSDIIMPGDAFILAADGCYDNSGGNSVEKGKFITWTPDGSSGTFRALINTHLEYTIIDHGSGKAIQAGSFMLM